MSTILSIYTDAGTRLASGEVILWTEAAGIIEDASHDAIRPFPTQITGLMCSDARIEVELTCSGWLPVTIPEPRGISPDEILRYVIVVDGEDLDNFRLVGYRSACRLATMGQNRARPELVLAAEEFMRSMR